MVALADMGCKTINVICDGTDVFVLLAHYFAKESLSVLLIMESTSRGRSSIDIGATVAKHSGVVPQLIAAHAVSGWRQLVATMVSGKQRLLKPCRIELNHLGHPKASLDDVMKESTHFIGAQVMDRTAIHPTQCLQSTKKFGYHALDERRPVSFRN